jgi:hypothetical protein
MASSLGKERHEAVHGRVHTGVLSDKIVLQLRDLPVEPALENAMPNETITPNKSLDGSNEGTTGSVSALDENLMKIAEELGTWLGKAERKTNEFLAQQKSMTDHLVTIRDTAARLLAQIEKGRERTR